MKNIENFIPVVLCAGLGTRLRPLTHCVSKVVAPLGDSPIAFTTIRTFLDAGFPVVHCNTHYLAPYVEAELKAALRFFGYEENRIRFWYEPELLNSGGGIQRIWEALVQEDSHNLKRDVIVASGDLYAHLPLQEMLTAWDRRETHQTNLMMTKQLNEVRPDVTWVDLNKQHVSGFGRDYSIDEAKQKGFVSRNFTGHQIISSQCLSKVSIQKVSSIDLYFRAALKRGETIHHLAYNETYDWYNIGTYIEYAEAMNATSVKGIVSIPIKNCLGILSAYSNTQTRSSSTLLGRTLQVNTLREMPRLGGESLLTLTKPLLKQGLAPLGETTLAENPLVFRISQSGLGLAHPVVIPLELYQPEWLAHSPHQSAYSLSQTLLLMQ